MVYNRYMRDNEKLIEIMKEYGFYDFIVEDEVDCGDYDFIDLISYSLIAYLEFGMRDTEMRFNGRNPNFGEQIAVIDFDKRLIKHAEWLRTSVLLRSKKDIFSLDLSKKMIDFLIENTLLEPYIPDSEENTILSITRKGSWFSSNLIRFYGIEDFHWLIAKKQMNNHPGSWNEMFNELIYKKET